MCFGTPSLAPAPDKPSITDPNVSKAGAEAVKGSRQQQTVFTSPTGLAGLDLSQNFLLAPILGAGSNLGSPTRPNLIGTQLPTSKSSAAFNPSTGTIKPTTLGLS